MHGFYKQVFSSSPDVSQLQKACTGVVAASGILPAGSTNPLLSFRFSVVAH